MFEVLEHLPAPEAALDRVFAAVDTLVVSFPNPALHEVHGALRAAADRHHELVQIDAFAQRAATGAILPGAGDGDDFWIFVVGTDGRRGSAS